MGADVFNERELQHVPAAARITARGRTSSATCSTPRRWRSGRPCRRTASSARAASTRSACRPRSPTRSRTPRRRANANAYDDYAKHANYKHRNKFALFGANDGMLHAILTGDVRHAGAERPYHAAEAEDQAPYEGYHDVGTGEELWAFVPPDLLPKLHLLAGDDHQYFVDGTPMVRDVWIDGGTTAERSSIGGGSATNERDPRGQRVPHRGGGRRAARRQPLLRARRHRRGATTATRQASLPVALSAADDEERSRSARPTRTSSRRRRPSGRCASTPARRPASGGAPTPTRRARRAASRSAGSCSSRRLRPAVHARPRRPHGGHRHRRGGVRLQPAERRAASPAARRRIRAATLNGGRLAVGMMMWGKDADFTCSARGPGRLLRHRDLRRHRRAALGAPLQRPGIIDASDGEGQELVRRAIFQQGAASAAGAAEPLRRAAVLPHHLEPACCGERPVPRARRDGRPVQPARPDRRRRCSPTNLRACVQKGCTVTLERRSARPSARASPDRRAPCTRNVRDDAPAVAGTLARRSPRPASGSASATCSASSLAHRDATISARARSSSAALLARPSRSLSSSPCRRPP